MSRRAIGLLARLGRHEIDRQRLVTSALAAELERAEEAIVVEKRRFALELDRAFELPGGPQPLAPFAEASRRRSCALIGHRAEIETRLDAAQTELLDAVKRWKSLDAALSLMRAAAGDSAARREQQEIEEAALLRRAGPQNSGARVTSRPSSAGPNLIWQESRELSRTS